MLVERPSATKYLGTGDGLLAEVSSGDGLLAEISSGGGLLAKVSSDLILFPNLPDVPNMLAIL